MSRRLAVSFASFCLATTCFAGQAPAGGLADKVQEIRLENGLRIFVFERPVSPTFAGYYQFDVGGAMDPKGASGIAHLLEHMLFKGTRTLGTLDHRKEAPLIERISELWHELHVELDRRDDPFHPADEARIAELQKEIAEVTAEQKKLIVKNEFDELTTRAGAVGQNASTNADRTNYFMSLPANRLELWFRIESDRLLNPVFREFYSERDVVHEERRMRTENNPDGLASEVLEGLVFPAHPYGTPVVGWPRDIERLTQEDAEGYFRTYYSPSNCVMVIAGDVKAAEVERLARKYFGAWKRQEIPRRAVTAELPQRGERRGVVEADAEASVQIAWPTVPQGHPDQYALDVLASLVGGLRSSRLDRTMVLGEKSASDVSSMHWAGKLAGMFGVDATPAPGHTVTELERGIERELKRVQEEGVTEAELERAKVQVEANRVRRLKSNSGMAFAIGNAVGASGDVAYLDERDRRVAAVTAEQVRDVARRYVVDSRKNVVEVRKVESAETGKKAEAGEMAHSHEGVTGERGAAPSGGFKQAMAMVESARPVELVVPEVGKEVQRVELPCGAVIFLKEDHSAPSIDMSLTWLGGSNSTPVAELAPYELAGALLTQGGTELLDPLALDERKEDLGMRFTVTTGATECNASFWSLARNFDESFKLALDVLMRPRLDEARLAVLRNQHVDQMRRRYDRPGQAVGIVQRHVTDGDHPRLGYEASRAEIEAVSADDVRRVWRRHFGSNNLRITAVGDFDATQVRRTLESAFCSWRPAEQVERLWVTREPVRRPGVFVVEKDVSAPAVMLVQMAKLDRTAAEADHAALEVLNDILGGSGFRSRLTERVRSDEGLTYGIRSWLVHESRPGVPGRLGISYQTKKTTVVRSIDSVMDEVRKIATQAVSEAEVREQVDAWTNRFIFDFTNDFATVSRLMSHELDDRPFDRDRQLLKAVQAVRVEDVTRVAKAYVRPEDFTICVFGKLGEADMAALRERYEVRVLPKSEVFKGGYDEEPRKGSPAQPSREQEKAAPRTSEQSVRPAARGSR
jgi:predicted Zn-dependent peptidase